MNLLNVDDKTVTEVARFQYDSQRPLLHCVRDTHIYIYIYHIISYHTDSVRTTYLDNLLPHVMIVMHFDISYNTNHIALYDYFLVLYSLYLCQLFWYLHRIHLMQHGTLSNRAGSNHCLSRNWECIGPCED